MDVLTLPQQSGVSSAHEDVIETIAVPAPAEPAMVLRCRIQRPERIDQAMARKVRVEVILPTGEGTIGGLVFRFDDVEVACYDEKIAS
jgi:hypothetical protein